MALNKAVSIAVSLFSDGTSTEFTLDLERDPYTIQETENYFVSDRKANIPIGVSAQAYEGIAVSATLAYPVVTLTFASAPTAGLGPNLGLTLLF